MRVSPEIAAGRREFFRAAGRVTALAVLSAAAAVLGRRGLPGQRCVNAGICSGCGQFAGCGLPQALSAKQARRIT
jgi:hypothetical protein